MFELLKKRSSFCLSAFTFFKIGEERRSLYFQWIIWLWFNLLWKGEKNCQK